MVEPKKVSFISWNSDPELNRQINEILGQEFVSNPLGGKTTLIATPDGSIIATSADYQIGDWQQYVSEVTHRGRWTATTCASHEQVTHSESDPFMPICSGRAPVLKGTLDPNKVNQARELILKAATNKVR